MKTFSELFICSVTKKFAETQKFPLFLFVLSFERCKIVFFVQVGVQDVVV